MSLKALIRRKCSQCGSEDTVKMYDDGIHVKTVLPHRCPNWNPELGPPNPPQSYRKGHAVLHPDDIGDENKILKTALEQACHDLTVAHNEILRIQGCDQSEFYNQDWPEWSSPANTIRWAEELLGKRLAKTDIWTNFPSEESKGKLEYLIESTIQSGMVICHRFGSIEHCYCTSDERMTFQSSEAAETFMKQNSLSDQNYFIAEHVFH
jgi:hypothetical protein